ncbi:hypothetical protein ATI61_110137 [Archangium gephyra]|uniref:Uncharacterized protein n=1 Tax=Archangium gephyra TaxID=48 RepID=A0ABX9JU76_9BACT|nr:hypothetical protein ATI61_110137 [Archangium gephyra]
MPLQRFVAAHSPPSQGGRGGLCPPARLRTVEPARFVLEELHVPFRAMDANPLPILYQPGGILHADNRR